MEADVQVYDVMKGMADYEEGTNVRGKPYEREGQDLQAWPYPFVIPTWQNG